MAASMVPFEIARQVIIEISYLPKLLTERCRVQSPSITYKFISNQRSLQAAYNCTGGLLLPQSSHYF